ncbi:MAG: type II toxin-antitoxin system HicB family antitoxin [Candidatus Vogelbacteria bacterium]
MSKNSKFTVELEQETDGRWIAEVQELPGVLCYGTNREEALAKAEVLAGKLSINAGLI